MQKLDEQPEAQALPDAVPPNPLRAVLREFVLAMMAPRL